MRKIWRKISYLGLYSKDIEPDMRINILANRLNFLLIPLLLFLFLITAHQVIANNKNVTFYIYRFLVQIIICIINILLAYKKYHKLVRLILSNSLLIVLILIPSFLGEIVEDNYLYFPYIIIAFYFFAVLLLNPKEEKIAYFFSLILSFCSLLFIEQVIIHFSKEELVLYGLLRDFLIFDKIVQISIFAFVTIALFYFKNLNLLYEKALFQRNEKLDKQNEQLKTVVDNLRHTQKMLVHSARMVSLGTFSSGVAHEINNPLNYIIGGIEILKKRTQKFNKLKKKNPEIAEILDNIQVSSTMIYEGIDKASKIVKSLMVFSSKGASKINDVDLNNILDEALHLLNFKIMDNISIITDFSKKAVTYGYPDKLHLAFLAILENAIYATLNSTKHDKKIEVRTRVLQNEKIRIEILNTGDHISEENLEHLFDPFFTTKDVGEGSGLGLSIAFSIIKEHDGHITANNLRNGVKFCIEIPIKEK